MLTGLTLPVITLCMLMGVMIDLALGEVRRWHPLVGFGFYANWLEKHLNHASGRVSGFFGWLCAVSPAVVFFFILQQWVGKYSLWGNAAIHILLLYFCLGLRSLRDHCLPIAAALQRGDIDSARRLTARIVSRDTEHSSASDLAKAGVESMLENGNDAVFGTLFWFIVAGGPGALLFRLANTLDAMWGYRTPRFLQFGCPAARIDDVMNWIPARLTALSYVLLGNSRNAWRCWQAQAKEWDSPNAGPVMAAGAGALTLLLGGAASYGGKMECRPTLGCGELASGTDIVRAWKLVATTAALWCCAMLIISAFIYWKANG